MIKYARLKNRLTQKQLAKIVGVNPSYICRFENRQVGCVSTDFIISLSDALNIDEIDVFKFVLYIKRQ